MRKIRALDNVYDLITINMEDRFKDNVAFRFYDTANDAVTTILYKDYVQDIRKAVNYFQSTISEIKGKKICLLTKNSYEYAVNTFGVVAAGAVLVLLNQRKSWDELSYELGLVEPDAILTDGDDYGFNDQLKAAYGDILRPMDGFRSYEPAQLTRCIDHEALMVLMFTSGTTGRSKGVMLSEKNFFSVMRAHTQIGEHMMAYKHEPDLVMSQYTVLPMFHLGAFICLFSWAHAGWALNVSSDIRNFYKEVKRMPSQAMAVVPVIMNSLHHDVMRGRKDRLGELWVPICSSAMFDPQVMLDMAEHGMFVVQTYGSTETCGDGIINYAQDAKHIGAVGQGNDYLDYKIAEDGELVVKGPLVCKGYHNNPGVTAQQITDGWLHTGDLGDISEDGFISITGRKKDLIITAGGKNVSPGLLEASVMTSPVVNQCLVIGDKKPFVAALVTLDLADANNWLESQGAKPEPDLASLAKNAIVHAEVERAVNAANEGVSRAESIRKFEILPDEFTEANGMLTPSLKTRRAQIVEHYRELIDDVIYVPLKK